MRNIYAFAAITLSQFAEASDDYVYAADERFCFREMMWFDEPSCSCHQPTICNYTGSGLCEFYGSPEKVLHPQDGCTCVTQNEYD